MTIDKIRYLHFLILWSIVGLIQLITGVALNFLADPSLALYVSTLFRDLWLFSLFIGTTLFISLTLSEILEPVADYFWPSRKAQEALEKIEVKSTPA